MSGEIPPALGKLANLEWLYLPEDRLSGEIPPELGNLVNLEELNLSTNQLERGDTAGVGQTRQPDRAVPRWEPVERVRAKQLVGPVGYGIFRPG